jgi:hypothetical protein
MNWKPTWVLLAAAAVCSPSSCGSSIRCGGSGNFKPAASFSPAWMLRWSPTLKSTLGPSHDPGRAPSSTNSWRLVKPVSYPAQSQRIEPCSTPWRNWNGWTASAKGTQRPAQRAGGIRLHQAPLHHSAARLRPGPPFGNRLLALSTTGFSCKLSATTPFTRPPPTSYGGFHRNKNQWRDLSLLNLTNLSFQTLARPRRRQ